MSTHFPRGTASALGLTWEQSGDCTCIRSLDINLPVGGDGEALQITDEGVGRTPGHGAGYRPLTEPGGTAGLGIYHNTHSANLLTASLLLCIPPVFTTIRNKKLSFFPSLRPFYTASFIPSTDYWLHFPKLLERKWNNRISLNAAIT